MATSAELFEQALRHQRTGNLALAEPLYRQILQADPTHGSACFYLGMLLAMQGQLAEAGACFRQTLRLHPDNADAYLKYRGKGSINNLTLNK